MKDNKFYYENGSGGMSTDTRNTLIETGGQLLGDLADTFWGDDSGTDTDTTQNTPTYDPNNLGLEPGSTFLYPPPTQPPSTSDEGGGSQNTILIIGGAIFFLIIIVVVMIFAFKK